MSGQKGDFEMKMRLRPFLLILGIVCVVFALTIVFVRFQRKTIFLHESSQHQLPEGAKFRIGKGRVTDIAYSPDSTLLAVATPIGIWLYDASTAEARTVLTADTYGISSISFSPDGKTLAGGGPAEIIYLWDVDTGECHHSFVGHNGEIFKVLFSADGNTLAAVSIHDISLWDVTTGTHEAKLPGFSNRGRSLWLNGDQVAFALPWDKDIRLSDKMLEGHTRSVESVLFSPDGQTLASGSHDRTLRLWDVATGTEKKTLKGHKKSINSMVFSRDGRMLVSTSDNTVRLWDVDRGTLKKTFREPNVSHVALSADGKTVASWGSDHILYLWDAVTGNPKKTITGHIGGISALSFSADGATLAIGASKEILLWDAIEGLHKNTLFGHKERVECVAFNPNGRTLASGSMDKTVRVWDAETGRQRKIIKGYVSGRDTYFAIRNVVFSSDGSTLASSSADGSVQLWDAATGKSKKILSGHTDDVETLVFSPDGRTVVGGASEWNKIAVWVWNVDTGKHKDTFSSRTSGVSPVAFSPDGSILASSDQDSVQLWDVATGELLKQLQGYVSPVYILPVANILSFSPDGKTLASGNWDRTIRLWDVSTGNEKKTLAGHKHWRDSSMAFSPDGQTLASASWDGTVLLWDITSVTHKTNDQK